MEAAMTVAQSRMMVTTAKLAERAGASRQIHAYVPIRSERACYTFIKTWHCQ